MNLTINVNNLNVTFTNIQKFTVLTGDSACGKSLLLRKLYKYFLLMNAQVAYINYLNYGDMKNLLVDKEYVLCDNFELYEGSEVYKALNETAANVIIASQHIIKQSAQYYTVHTEDNVSFKLKEMLT